MGRPRLPVGPSVAWPAVAVERVLLAEPRGFCAGVEMAIKALVWMVRTFEPPVYCYHEIVHNRLIVERFERARRGVRRRHRRRPAGLADHAVGARVGAGGGRGSPRAGQLRRRLGVPARDEGPPRGQGARRQGLPHRLRRPRGPRGGRRHDGRGAGRHHAASRRSTRSPRLPDFDSPSPCSPRRRCRTATGATSPSPCVSGSPMCGHPGAATSASRRPTASRR